MIRLILNGDMVVGLPLVVDPSYQPKENEIVVDEMPHVDLKDNEKAYVFWRNGQIEYEIKGE